MSSVVASSSMLSATRWAVLGDVLNAAKPASRIVARLRANKKTVFLVNPRAPTTDDDNAQPRVYPSLATLLSSEPIDVLDLVINSTEGLKQLSELPADTKLQVFIQPGAASNDIKQLCAQRSWPFHEGCVLVELPSHL
jgi:predicted CoA-binding protein